MPSESVSATIAAALKRAPNVLQHLGLDPKKPSKWKQVGAGETARVWRLPNGDVLKATVDSNDAWASQLILDEGPVDGLVRVKAVFTVPRQFRQDSDVYLIVEEYAPALDSLSVKSHPGSVTDQKLRRLLERGTAARAAQKRLSWYSSGSNHDTDVGAAFDSTTGSHRYPQALAIAQRDFDQLLRGWLWLKERNFRVGDIHDGNVGLTADDRVVLFDLGANRNSFAGRAGTEPKVAVASNARSTETGLPRTSAIFDQLFDQFADDFDDFGEIELHCDEAAGSDNGHGSDRQFGYCSTEAPWRIAFAAKIETLPDEYISGLVRHELGHALDHRYGRKALEKRFGKKLPDSVERRADKIAEYAFGEPIEYGDLDIQCVACEGKTARPKRLG